MNQNFIDQFQNQVGELQLNEPLKNYTSMGVGGPATYFYLAQNLDKLILALKLAREFSIPIFIIGAGTDIIISDQGLDKLVIKISLLDYEILDTRHSGFDPESPPIPIPVLARHKSLKNSNYSTGLPNSFFHDDEKVQGKVGSGWKIIPLVNKLHEQGITGLEWFTGIPASLGGGVYNNIHGGKYFLSDFIDSVEVLDSNQNLKTYTNQELNFDYDKSLVQESKEIVVSLTLNLYKGNVKNAKNVVQKWGIEKNLNQAQRSAGCTWHNLTKEQQEKLNLSTPSIGYIVDKILNLKGKKIGDAQVSLKHAAFIENLGNATAADVHSLIKLVESQFEKKIGFKLKREIELIGKF
jgi:UDP-N-acetylmuramate dehydrogenase